MIAPTAPVTLSNPAEIKAPPAKEALEIGFADVLSALNPLQYLPVVGQIYRAVTGDVPPEPLRIMGSIVVSGLLGGPLGMALNAASALVQHLTGINLDAVAHDAMEAVGIVEQRPPVPTADVPTALAAYGQTLFTYGPGGGHA
jgi:hypothetical protein